MEINRRNARAWSMMGINSCIWNYGLSEVFEKRADIAVITADLERYSGLARTFRSHPDECHNVGIAEQNMVGIGAGMAMEGLQVFMTTYAPFMSLRCADQVRHLMGNMNLNMKAIASAAGLTAGYSGAALLAVNDIAFMRSIPNMTVIQPADCTEAIKALISMSEINGPVYMRFCGSTRLPMVYSTDYQFEIGKGIVLSEGSDLAIVASGTTIVSECLRAAELVENKLGIRPTVVDMHTIKPLDLSLLDSLARKHRYIITVEEHSVIGGLGSAVSEHLAQCGHSCRQRIIGIADRVPIMGSREFMLEQAGLTAKPIAEECCSLLQRIDID